MDKEHFAIGRLGAPKGVRGDLKVQSYSGEFGHFRRLKEVDLLGEVAADGAPRKYRLKVARIEGEGAAFTMAFEGYPSPETARALTGLEIIVPRAAAAPLKKNEWYIDDLIGLSLVYQGKAVATVRSVLEGGADPWLESLVPAGPAGGEQRVVLVPFRKEFVGEVDAKAGTIELLAPELLEE